MTVGEFYFWMAYDQLFPLDSTRRLEAMLARLEAQMFNVRRGKGQSAQRAERHLPKYEGYQEVRRPVVGPDLAAESHLKALFRVWGAMWRR